MGNELQTRCGGFALQPQSMNEAMQMATMLSESNMVPKCYQQKNGDTLVAMMMGSELGLNPIQSLQNIAVINGRPSIWGDAMLALVQNHPKFGGIKEEFDEANMKAKCAVWRKNGDKHIVTFSQADAQSANLWGKQGPWSNYPKRMLQLRARGFALRDQFADALSGLISAEEAQDMPEGVDIVGGGAPLEQNKAIGADMEAQPEVVSEFYPDDQFEAMFPNWEFLVLNKKKTPAQIIEVAADKGINLSDDQKFKVMEIKEAE